MDDYLKYRLEELERERKPAVKINKKHKVAEHADGTVIERYKLDNGRELYRIINGGFVAMTFADEGNKNMCINNIQKMAADWALLKLDATK